MSSRKGLIRSYFHSPKKRGHHVYTLKSSSSLISGETGCKRRAIFSGRQLKEAAEDVRYRKRYQLVFGALLSVVGAAMRREFSKQEDLVKMLAAIAEKVKAAKEKEVRHFVNTEFWEGKGKKRCENRVPTQVL